MELIKAFEEGKVEGIENIESTIDTQISKLFVGTKKIYKVYLKRDTFFGDLRDFEYRKNFYSQDFSWNQEMSPQVYLNLYPVKFENGRFIIVSDSDAEDYFIEMNLIDTSSSITDMAISGELTENDVKNIANKFNEKIDKLTEDKVAEISQISDSWLKLWKDRADDLEPFALEQDLVSKELTKKIAEILKKTSEKSDYINNFPSRKLVVGIDGHSDNIFIYNNEVVFLDIFLVKEEWRLIDPHFNICRIGVDIKALGQTELCSVFYNSSKYNPYDLPEEIRLVYELSSAAIKGIYYAIIGKEELAKKYFPIIENLVEELEACAVTTG